MTQEIKNTYFELKNKMDAAYIVFAKKPTSTNNSRYTEASQAFRDYCIETMAKLVEDTPADNTTTILENVDKYKSCAQCGSLLLYAVTEDRYVASGDFVEDFPGWCHTCLADYCCTHECETCELAADHTTCTFKEIKKIYTEEA